VAGGDLDADYLFLMHDDAPATGNEASSNDWGPYINSLQASGTSRVEARSVRASARAVPAITGHLSGFIRVGADNMDHARTLLSGTPVFEAGGTVEIPELLRTK
jgi:hypothetical protein